MKKVRTRMRVQTKNEEKICTESKNIMAKLYSSKDGTFTKGAVSVVLDVQSGTIYLRGTTFPEDGKIPTGTTLVDFKPLIERAAAEAKILNERNNTSRYEERVFDIGVRKTPKGARYYTRIYYKNKLEALCEGLPRYAGQDGKLGDVRVGDKLRDVLTANFIIWKDVAPKWRPIIDEKSIPDDFNNMGSAFPC